MQLCKIRQEKLYLLKQLLFMDINNPSANEIDRLSDLQLRVMFKKSGNKIYIGELYRRYIHLVLGVCFKYLHNPVEANDAAMEIFESLFDKLNHHDIKSFKSWLYIVSRNHCLQHLRQQKKINTIPLNEDFFSETFMENSSFQHHEEDEKDMLLAVLPGLLYELPPGQQQCVSYYYYDNHTYAEISYKTNFSIKQVKSHLQNGKRNLKQMLESRLKNFQL
ncbi:sigma-70 family RNA polymerase sigma factor [Lentimicrobium sp.]